MKRHQIESSRKSKGIANRLTALFLSLSLALTLVNPVVVLAEESDVVLSFNNRSGYSADTQGANGWYYMYNADGSGASFQPMPHQSNNGWSTVPFVGGGAVWSDVTFVGPVSIYRDGGATYIPAWVLKSPGNGQISLAGTRDLKVDVGTGSIANMNVTSGVSDTGAPIAVSAGEYIIFSRTGAGEEWYDFTATFTGTVVNDPVDPSEILEFNSNTGFSLDTQGANGWYYMYSPSTEGINFIPMP